MLRTLFLALLLALPLAADNNYVAQDWQKKIQASTAALKEGDHARSLKISNRLLVDMVEKLGPGKTETHAFAVVVVHKAVASAGLGKYDDARWYWHVALGLEPALVKADFTPFGEAGKYVSGIDVREAKERGPADAKPITAEITAPKLLKKVDPQFPYGAQAFGVEGILIVEIIINTDGKVTDPAVLKPLPAPTLSYAALEAVRRWKFEPGKLDGKVVPVIFNLTVKYKL